MNSKSESNTGKKLTASIVTIIVLLFCLCITTYALVKETVNIRDNTFQTGIVEINLNNGRPVIEAHEFLFEPGMTVKKDFFIENNSTWDVYYKIYFENVDGGLADVLQIVIKDDTSVLFSGTAKELTSANVSAADDVLKTGQRKEMEIVFHFPEAEGNSAQNRTLTFDMTARAVQTKNNPNKLFE